MDRLVSELHLQAERVAPSGTPVNRPRVGLYRPWTASIDEGWTRWLFENFEFAFSSLYDADVRSGSLRDRYDVIVLADMSRGEIVDGSPKGSVPPRFEGGLGREGVRALDEFVRLGGTLVCLNRSSQFAIEELHLPVENVVGELGRDKYYLSGSIVEMTVDPSHPVMAGMPPRAKVMAGSSPVFTVKEGFDGAVLAKYQTTGTPLLSGYLLGDEYVRGYATALAVRHGDGHVVLLGMRTQWRGQSYGTFPILFNSALYSSQVAAVAPVNREFWSAPAKKEEEKPESR
jgi:hypothetical protein